MPNLSTLELKQRIKEDAPRVASAIGEAAKRAANEAQFALSVSNIVGDFAKALGIELELLVEHHVATGNIDALYNRFVIEYERPGTLTDNNASGKNTEAINQVKKYISGLSEKEKRAERRFAGVATDGYYYIFVRFIDGSFRLDEPRKVTARTTELFLEYLAALAVEKPLTGENLIADFGIGTDIATAVVPAFYDLAAGKMEARAEAIFGQWAENFSEACDYEKGIAHAKRTVLQKAADSFGIPVKEPRPLPLFFAIHTYFALLVKLLALQMATVHRFRRRPRNILKEMVDYGPDKLRERLVEVESGDIFDRLGIKNYLEADFFSWYLGTWDGRLGETLSPLVGALYRYDFPGTETQPDEYRDILKEIYQDLMPRELRHNLGEYYTPDWLVERILNQLGYDGDPGIRILDPACGSGTFLYHEVSRVRRKGLAEYASEPELLRSVLSNVVGFDLNPVAVITARTSYLLALGELLDYQDQDVFFPVYTADSIMTPHQGKFLEVAGALVLDTTVGEFRIPETLSALPDLHRFTEDLGLHARNELEPDRFVGKCKERFPALDRADLAHVRFTYERILELERQGKNRIWGAIIKNMFAPVFVKTFDLIAGNPPWILWDHLPEKYRRKTFEVWQTYGLFPHKGYEKILGHAKDDISTLMTYVAMDKYLKKRGKLGFVIPQSAFKAAKAGMGFRRFRLGEGEFIKVVAVDDMVELKPFPGVGNRTAVMILQKGLKTKYPVPYEYWKKKNRTSLKPAMTLNEVSELTKSLRFYARPVSSDDATSAWITARKKALEAAKKVLGKSEYKAHAGVYSGGANGVFWVDIIEKKLNGELIITNRPRDGNIPLPEVEAVIEPNLVYPLIKSGDVKRWSAEPSTYIILTHLEGERLKAVPEEIMKDRFPLTYAYLKRFEDILRERAAYRRYFQKTDPFYSMFDVGDYTFAKYHVYWGRIGSTINAVTINNSERLVLTQETVTIIRFSNLTEAYYVSAVANSVVFNFVCAVFSQVGGKSFGTPGIVENIKIPFFIENEGDYIYISRKSRQAHELAAAGENDKLADVEAEIDERVAHLYGITDAELNEIQKSMAELLE
jgi:hypothetical protein